MLHEVARVNVLVVRVCCRLSAKFFVVIVVRTLLHSLGEAIMVMPVRPPVEVWITVGLLTLTRLTYLLLLVFEVIALANGQRPMMMRLNVETLSLVNLWVRLLC